MSERGRLLEDDVEILRALRDATRIAVIGIKPDSRRHTAAYYVPAYLDRVGYEIVPVPVYYPDVTEILGKPVFRSLAEVPGAIDLVLIFRRPPDVPGHVDEIIARRPHTVWMQLGIRNDGAARRLTDAGIDVVQDRCAMIEHRAL